MNEERKEMLTVSTEGSKTKVSINFSSLDIINVCMRKAYYSLERGLVSKESPPALVFGSAIHKALEHYYQLSPELRVWNPKLKEEAELIGYSDDRNVEHPLLDTIRVFTKNAESLQALDESELRSIQHGIKILIKYFKTYQDDCLVVVSDSEGPIVERMLRYNIHEDDKLIIEYFGTVDCILENKQTGIIAVTDHKTTSTLGQKFYSRVNPNHQYTGYVLGAREALGIKTNTFLVNGIGVAKTKQDLARQFTERTEEDFAELKSSVVFAVKKYLTCKAANSWPQNAPNPCTMYGECQFLRVCAVPEALRENIIKGQWEE